MKLFKRSILTALLTSFVVSSQAQAATLTSREQVSRVVEWFTGLFDNTEQVSTEPDVPFLTMENCVASPFGDIVSTDSQYVHLEQYIGGTSLLRTSGYEFSPITSGVSLKVYSYAERDAAVGTCNDPNPSINLSNLVSPSCDLTLIYEPESFFGTNSPTGCASGFPLPGSTVVSTVEITADGVDALDRFFADGLPPIGTEIEFRRIATTNEPRSAIALISLAIIGLAKSRRR